MSLDYADDRPPRFVRRKDVLARIGLSEATVWRLERSGQFPKARRIGVRAVAYLEEEITAWIASRRVTAAIGTTAEPLTQTTRTEDG